MSIVQELLEQGKLDELLAYVQGKDDPECQLGEIAAYAGKNQPQKALALLLERREALFKAKPLATMRFNLSLRFTLKQFDEAYQDAEFYENQPYQSQQVEEFLATIRDEIRHAEKASFSHVYEEDELHDALSGKEGEEILSAALHQLIQKGIEGYEEDLIALCSAKIRRDLRSFALELLAAYGYPEKVAFDLGKEIIEVTPKELFLPFRDDAYLCLKNRLLTQKDAGAGEMALSLLDQLVMLTYPENSLYQNGGLAEKALLALVDSYKEGAIYVSDASELGELALSIQEALLPN